MKNVSPKPLQTKNKQSKKAGIFPTVYNGIFIFTNANKKFYFKKTIKTEMVSSRFIIKISPQGPIINFMFDDSVRGFFGIKC